MPVFLNNQVWLITGSSGIAEATVRLAARAGAEVFVVSNNETQCQQLSDDLSSAGALCHSHIADLTDARQVQEAVELCVTRCGRVDALFNVVGISGRRFGDGAIHECTDEAWQMTMTTNVTTIFLMCREVIRQMLQQSPNTSGIHGSILNMSSVLALSPEREHFATHAYAASKGAIISLSKAMAASYAPYKIRVNVIAPALTRTPMSERAQTNPQILELMKTRQPLAENLIEADDVARAAAFLLSDEARYITGEVLTVDAGWRVS